MWPKIIASFLSVFVIFLISFLTFSSGSWKTDYYSKFKIPEEWNFSIIKDEKWDFREFESEQKSQIFMERFNYIDKIFYSKKWSYTKKLSPYLTSLRIWKWKYFFSFSYPKKYQISWSGFNLNFVWPINLYINSEDINKTDIFSSNNMAELILLGLFDNKPKTKVYIYPHMLFTLNLKFNNILANSDLFRIYQLNWDVPYVNQSLYTSTYNLEKTPNLDNYFFRGVLSYFNSQYVDNALLDSLLQEKFDNMTYDYIKKYFVIFINDNKKISYYKDLIYMNLLKISMSSKNSNGIFSETQDYFIELKKLSEDDYNEMLKILVYFKSKFILDNIPENIEKEIKYDKILEWVLWFKKLEWNYMLYYIFNLFDLWKNDNFFNWIISFSDSLLWYNWLKIEEDKLLWNSDSKNIKLGYYVSFLESIIKAHLISDFDNKKIKGIIEIFNKYSLLSVNVYWNWDIYTKKTAIVLNLNLLKELAEYVRNTFFEKDLKKWVLLVKKQKLYIDAEIIMLLDKSYNRLFSFFENNKSIFDENLEKDNLYIKDYEFISIDFSEYLSALKNYDRYKSNKNDLYNTETLMGQNDKVSYTVDDISNYLSNFNWVDKNSIKVKTDDEGIVFSVELNIGWKEFSFDLYPYDNYKLNNMYIDWEKKGYSYKLNLIKEEMSRQLSSNLDPEDKKSNDFKDFFINTFLQIKTSKPVDPTIVPDPYVPVIKEDTETLVFKRDQLIGKEFSILKGFTKIEMNNILVSDTDIKLKDVKVFFTFNEWDNNNNIYWALLNSDYSIKDHYFSNIKLRIYKNVVDWNLNIEQFGLWNEKYISIIWNIWIRSFEDFTKNLLTYYNNIVYVNNIITEKASNVEISVGSSNKVIKFNFIYNGKKYEISLLKSSIINFKRDWEKIITTTFNYTDLPNRIDLLLK